MSYNREVLSTGSVEEMGGLELSRWLALFEGVNIIADTAKEHGVKFSSLHIKPLALEKYVDSNSEIIYRSLTNKGLR